MQKSNKKLGNEFEQEFCKTLYNHGFWVHNLAQNKAGQPADVLAVRNGKAHLIDCKVCSTKQGFFMKRVEENQRNSMRFWENCGNGCGWFALLVNNHVYMLSSTLMQNLKSASRLLPNDVIGLGKKLEEWLNDVY